MWANPGPSVSIPQSVNTFQSPASQISALPYVKMARIRAVLLIGHSREETGSLGESLTYKKWSVCVFSTDNTRNPAHHLQKWLQDCFQKFQCRYHLDLKVDAERQFSRRR